MVRYLLTLVNDNPSPDPAITGALNRPADAATALATAAPDRRTE
jgi:hypothetical protein